jgi:AcrR family transcriptional regulator
MSRPRTRSDDDILDATAKVLLRAGPHAFTLADVAKEVGLAPATLLQRFGTKQGLLVAFGRRASSVTPAFVERAEEGGRKGVRPLRASLVELAAKVGRREQLANSLALLLEDVRVPPLREAAKKHAEAMEAAIAEHIEAAQARRELRRRAAPVDVAHVVYAVWNGALVQWALRGRGGIEQWVGRAIDLALAPYR